MVQNTFVASRIELKGGITLDEAKQLVSKTKGSPEAEYVRLGLERSGSMDFGTSTHGDPTLGVLGSSESTRRSLV